MIIVHLFDQVGHHLHVGHHCLHILLLIGKCSIEEVVAHLSKLMTYGDGGKSEILLLKNTSLLNVVPLPKKKLPTLQVFSMQRFGVCTQYIVHAKFIMITAGSMLILPIVFQRNPSLSFPSTFLSFSLFVILSSMIGGYYTQWVNGQI